MFGLDRYAHKMTMPSAEKALPGREQVYLPKNQHFVLAESLLPEYPVGTERAIFGMGCFWGVERLFWQQKGIFVTAVGYGGGYTPNPTYEEVCSGQTGHNEWVLVVYWPNEISYTQLLSLFWNNHNPTQVMRQGNDLGTQYRSGIYYCSEEQKDLAIASKQSYQQILAQRGGGQLATEIVEAGPFYFAEDYHQQYLAKNPGGYCNMQSCAKTGLPQWQA